MSRLAYFAGNHMTNPCAVQANKIAEKNEMEGKPLSGRLLGFLAITAIPKLVNQNHAYNFQRMSLTSDTSAR